MKSPTFYSLKKTALPSQDMDLTLTRYEVNTIINVFRYVHYFEHLDMWFSFYQLKQDTVKFFLL